MHKVKSSFDDVINP